MIASLRVMHIVESCKRHKIMAQTSALRHHRVINDDRLRRFE